MNSGDLLREPLALAEDVQTRSRFLPPRAVALAGGLLSLTLVAGCGPALHEDTNFNPASSEYQVEPRVQIDHEPLASPVPQTLQRRNHSLGIKTLKLVNAQNASKQGEAARSAGVHFTPREQACLDGVTTIVHRGMGFGAKQYHGEVYPEDTPKAFKEGIRLGACGFETDFWYTKSGYIISQHDPSLARMTNSNLPTVDWKPGLGVYGPAHTPISTAEQILKTMRPYTCFRQLELKQYHAPEIALERLVAYNNRYVKDPRCVMFTASNIETLGRIKHIDPRYTTALIEHSDTGRPNPADLAKHTVMHDGIEYQAVDVINVDYHAVDKRYVQRARRNGLEISARNVDSLPIMQKLKREGVRRMVTNRADIIRRHQ